MHDFPPVFLVIQVSSLVISVIACYHYSSTVRAMTGRPLVLDYFNLQYFSLDHSARCTSSFKFSVKSNIAYDMTLFMVLSSASGIH